MQRGLHVADFERFKPGPAVVNDSCAVAAAHRCCRASGTTKGRIWLSGARRRSFSKAISTRVPPPPPPLLPPTRTHARPLACGHVQCGYVRDGCVSSCLPHICLPWQSRRTTPSGYACLYSAREQYVMRQPLGIAPQFVSCLHLPFCGICGGACTCNVSISNRYAIRRSILKAFGFVCCQRQNQSIRGHPSAFASHVKLTGPL